MLSESTKTIVALLAFTEYAQADGDQTRLDSLPHSAEQHARLRTLFNSPRYRQAGFEVLDLKSCTDSGDVLKRLKQVGDLANSRPVASVVLVWSGHGQTFDRDLRLATPECTDPLDDTSGLPAKEIVIQSGARRARHFCVFIDACEAGGSALEFAQVAAAREWNGADNEHSFAAFYASYPFAGEKKAKDGVYLSLLASVLERGPSKEAVARARQAWGNFGFNDKDRLLSAEDIEQGISAEILADPQVARGVQVPGATKFGAQYLFPNPLFSASAPARMVDQEALDTHFLPKARGIEPSEQGWHFTGRVQATRDILQWANAEPGSAPPVYVLIGSGGTGKSALVGRLIALADPDARERLRAEGWSEEEDRTRGTLPAVGLFDAAMHLRNLTAQRVVDQLGDLLRLDRQTSPAAFVDKIAQQGNTAKLLIFDALDEAEDPQAVALAVIRPLARIGCRILVATRRSAKARGAEDLLQLLAGVSVEPHDLDADVHSRKDIADYVVERIRAAHSPQFADDPALVELASAKISERADGKFLYARIATSNLLRCVEPVSAETLDQMLKVDVGGVFEQDLQTIDRAFQDHFKRKDRGASRLLEALAWAQGNGIPIRDGLWATVGNALASRPRPGVAPEFLIDHVRWVLREAGRYVLEDGDGDQAVYRLFHQSLIDHFRPNPDAESDTARAVSDALNGLVVGMGGWALANPYLVRQMAAHRALCRPQTELHDLLVEFEWVRARLEISDAQALVDDYDYVNDPAPAAVAQVGRTLSMTAHILAKDKQQLIPQLLGRLPPEDDALRRMREATRRAMDRPMWIPRLGGLSQSGALIRVIESPGFVDINDVAFSSDGTLVASGHQDGTVCLWDTCSGQAWGEPLRGHDGDVWSVAFSSDGTLVASGGNDKTVRLWDARSGQALGEPLRRHDGVTHVAFSPDGTRVASASNNGTVRLWDARSGQPLGESLPGHVGAVTHVAFSPDGTRVASGGEDRTVRLWDARSGQAVAIVFGDTSFGPMAVNPLGLTLQVVAAQSSGRLVFLDLFEPAAHPPASTNT